MDLPHFPQRAFPTPARAPEATAQQPVPFTHSARKQRERRRTVSAGTQKGSTLGEADPFWSARWTNQRRATRYCSHVAAERLVQSPHLRKRPLRRSHPARVQHGGKSSSTPPRHHSIVHTCDTRHLWCMTQPLPVESIRDVRAHLAEVVERADRDDVPTVITRRGKEVAAVVSIDVLRK